MSDDRWPMVERLTVGALNSRLSDGSRPKAGTRVPPKVETLDGFIRVIRGPGGDDGVTDSPLLDLEAFHPEQVKAWDLAEAARQVMLSLQGTTAAGHLIDRVETASGPVRVEYGPHVERYVASYRIEFRR